jgi:hypothetical protein
MQKNKTDRLLQTMAREIAKTNPQAALCAVIVSYRRLWLKQQAAAS